MAQPVAAPPPLPANRGPYAARLALKLVEEALGPLCRTVLKCLLDHGMQQVRCKCWAWGSCRWDCCRSTWAVGLLVKHHNPLGLPCAVWRPGANVQAATDAAAGWPAGADSAQLRQRLPEAGGWVAPLMQRCCKGWLAADEVLHRILVCFFAAGGCFLVLLQHWTMQLRATIVPLTTCTPDVSCPLQEPPTLRGPGPSYSLYQAALPRILQSLRSVSASWGLGGR